MRLIGMMPVRNEAWCLGLSLRVALMWCDEVVVLLHACEDASADIALSIAREYHPRVIVVGKDGDWREMEHRQAMLELARARGATHLAIIDADEVLSGNLLEGNEIQARVMTQLHAQDILQLPGYNLRNGINQYHINGIWGNRWFSTAFAYDMALSWSGDKFHSREPHGKQLQAYRPIQQGQGGVMHLWGASERRLIAKHSLYKVTERLRWPEKSVQEIDRMYSWAIHGSGPADSPASWKYAGVPESWWKPYEHMMKYLVINAEPWQEAETRRLVAEHGRDTFAGLDLFGVA